MKGTLSLGRSAAYTLVLIYLVGIVMNFTLLDTSAITDSVALVEFMAAHAPLMTAWITLLYVVFGVVLVFLTLILQEVLMPADPLAAKAGACFGFIWAGLLIASGMVHNVGMAMAVELLPGDPAAAGALFRAVTGIHLGLGGGNEVAGALWMLLVCRTAAAHGLIGKWTNRAGLLAGTAGLLTLIPPLFTPAAGIFALGQMLWWLGLGAALAVKEPLRKKAAAL